MTIPLQTPRAGPRHAGMAIPLCMVLALACAGWLGGAQAQDLRSATPKDLRFRDFYRQPVGPKGLEISDTLRGAQGQHVRLTGYMVQQDSPLPGRFLLTPRPVQMSEHADGEADDLPAATVVVLLEPAQQDWIVRHEQGLLRLSGTLSVGREEERDGRVSWVRLRLDPGSARPPEVQQSAAQVHAAKPGE